MTSADEEEHKAMLLEYRLAPNLYIGPSHQLPPSSVKTEERRALDPNFNPTATATFNEAIRRLRAPSIWRSQDPREVFNKRGSIVVLVPSAAGFGTFVPFTAHVDTKEGYYVSLYGQASQVEPQRRHVTEDEPWPEAWLWTHAPSEEG